MDTLSHRLGVKVKGILEGFDRIVFKGILQPLSFGVGMQLFLHQRGVLNKGFKNWATEVSTAIVQSAEEYSKAQIGQGVVYLPTYKTRKETLAHEQQLKLGIVSGFIGAWSCLESCQTFKAAFDSGASLPKITKIPSRCKHLYFLFRP